MSWIEIPIIGDLLGKTADIVDKAVIDKDKRNEIIGNLHALGTQVYIAELNTKTIPWIDGLHKMGRQLLNFATIAAVVALLMFDIEITGPVALVLAGPNAAYQIIKGTGSK